jgi:cysteine dioxygenase
MPLIQQMQTRIDQKAVRKTLQEVPIPLPQLWPYIIFSPEGYHHVWLWCQKGFEIILLCWLEGQETPIHDHAGSRGLDLVRLGKMWEKVFEEKEGGHLVERTTNTLIAGGIGVIGPHLIHQTGNMGPGRLLSLHIYWRPIDRRRVRTDQPALNQESDTGRRWR